MCPDKIMLLKLGSRLHKLQESCPACHARESAEEDEHDGDDDEDVAAEVPGESDAQVKWHCADPDGTADNPKQPSDPASDYIERKHRPDETDSGRNMLPYSWLALGVFPVLLNFSGQQVHYVSK